MVNSAPQLWATGTETGQWRVAATRQWQRLRVGRPRRTVPHEVRRASSRTSGPLDVTSRRVRGRVQRGQGPRGPRPVRPRTPEEDLLAELRLSEPGDPTWARDVPRAGATIGGSRRTQQARFFDDDHVWPRPTRSSAAPKSKEECTTSGGRSPRSAMRRPVATRETNGRSRLAGAVSDAARYPDEPSGYNCYTAAMMAQRPSCSTAPTRSHFSLTSPGHGAAWPGSDAAKYKHYTRLSSHDTIEGRILTGFHFRSAGRPRRQAGQEGRPMGGRSTSRTGRLSRSSTTVPVPMRDRDRPLMDEHGAAGDACE